MTDDQDAHKVRHCDVCGERANRLEGSEQKGGEDRS